MSIGTTSKENNTEYRYDRRHHHIRWVSVVLALSVFAFAVIGPAAATVAGDTTARVGSLSLLLLLFVK
jgi:hypothetical protein